MNRDFYVKKFGRHALSQTTLAPPFHFFEHDCGYIPYLSLKLPLISKKCISAVGDPVCNTKDAPKLIAAFRAKHPQACFYQLSAPFAPLFKDSGYNLNQMGTESLIHLDSFKATYAFKRKVNQNNLQDVTITESSPLLHKQAISNLKSRWLGTRVRQKENSAFLTKPLSFSKYSRYFFAWQNDELVGFRSFDPLFEEHLLKGYYADTSYTCPTAPRNLSYKLLDKAIATFQSDGVQFLSLGLNPFHLQTQNVSHDNFLLKHALKLSYQHLNSLYSFKGLTQHKRTVSKFTVPVYFAAPHKFPFFNMLRSCLHMLNF